MNREINEKTVSTEQKNVVTNNETENKEEIMSAAIDEYVRNNKKRKLKFILMSIIIILIIAVAFGIYYFNIKNYDPEMIVRNTCYDELCEPPEGFEGKLFGYIASSMALDSFVYTSHEDGKFMWDDEWTVNKDIYWYDEIINEYSFQEKKEDLLCVTLSENIDYLDYAGRDIAFSCVFSIDKKTKESKPILYITTYDNNIIEQEFLKDSTALYCFYIRMKYEGENLEYIKNVVYGRYN